MTSDRREIANHLLTQHADVREAVVVETAGRTGQNTELLALVRPDGYCSGADLRDALISSVGLEPSPPVVVLVSDEAGWAEARADHRRLVELAAGSPYVYEWREPAGEVERSLCDVVADCLGRDRVSPVDNFVDIGGDSVTAIKVVTELERRYGIALPLESLFEARSIAEVVQPANP